MRFYLGTHEPSWLSREEVTAPLFISYNRLRRRKSAYPPALTSYCIDSTGFTQLSQYGRWTITPEDYVGDVVRISGQAGPPIWAAPQDHMCEPFILAKTGGTVRGHQQATVRNFSVLRRLWTESCDRVCPFIPVLQGWHPADYRTCLAMYADAGIDLDAFPAVGIGSVCRRQDSDAIHEVVEGVLEEAPDLKLHGFGVKVGGITRYGHLLASSDSLAWSFGARWNKTRLPGCSHATCANCPRYAMAWYRKVTAVASRVNPQPRQLSIFRQS